MAGLVEQTLRACGKKEGIHALFIREETARIFSSGLSQGGERRGTSGGKQPPKPRSRVLEKNHSRGVERGQAALSQREPAFSV